MIVKDADGREIEARALSAKEEFELAGKVGAPGDSATWWAMVKIVCAVRTLDGAMVHPPGSRKQIGQLKTRLGIAGYRAIQTALATETDAVAPAEIDFKPLDELELIDLLEMGGRQADIAAWVGLAFTGCGIRRIGGETFTFPATREELVKAVSRLDDPAVQAALQEESSLFSEKAETADDEEARAKN